MALRVVILWCVLVYFSVGRGGKERVCKYASVLSCYIIYTVRLGVRERLIWC